MKKIKVVVLEVGLDYVEKVDYFFIEVPEDKWEAVAEAVKAVEDRGYKVLSDNQGGNNEYVKVDSDEEYIAVTIRCAEGEEEE